MTAKRQEAQLREALDELEKAINAVARNLCSNTNVLAVEPRVRESFGRIRQRLDAVRAAVESSRSSTAA